MPAEPAKKFSRSPYQQAADILTKLWASNSSTSLKPLVYGKNKQLLCSKAAYAQTCQVLKHYKTLERVLELVPFDNVQNQALLYVLVYELLLGPHHKISGGGQLKRRILAKQDELTVALKSAQQQDKNKVPVDLNFPRYVRVNTLQTTCKSVVQQLKAKDIDNIQLDQHIPDLLVLPQSTTSQILSLFTDNSTNIVLQDKSSCFSAYCLTHGFTNNWWQGKQVEVIDACAAPGNKTTHLAALLAANNNNNTLTKATTTSTTTATIHAFDRNKKRCQLLQERTKQLIGSGGNSSVTINVKHQDFLQSKPSEYVNVKAIMLDPSCSGSGLYTSIERVLDTTDDNDRLEHLGNFQYTCIQHAMSFDSVDYIVYSTCSIHVRENERVVAQALANKDWTVVAPACLQTWKRRGQCVEGLTNDEASCLIRVDWQDNTNGFFVACFQRRSSILTRKVSNKHIYPDIVKQGKELGLKLYQGLEQKPEQTSDCKVKQNEKVDAPSTVASRKQTKLPTIVTENTQNKSSAVQGKNPAKKAQKKLAWKAKQAELKRRRLDKKNPISTE